jgi:CelD/BcsL family acetyltransferase involved in cellulose biosynthesis
MPAGRDLRFRDALRPALSEPDFGEWAVHYPNGLGPSAFAAPEWQRLMLREEPPGSELRWLSAPAPHGPLTLPVLARRVRGGRWDLATRPIAYYVEPIEQPLGEMADLEALLRVIASPWVTGFSLWLTPWSPLRPAAGRRGLGRVRLDTTQSFVIRRELDALGHVARHVSRTRRRRLAANERHGLALRSDPDRAQRDAFEALYRRSHQERDWVGPTFSSAFFEGAATRLGRGGELCVALLGDRVVGGGVLLFDQQAVHYFMGAIDRSQSEVSPHDALYLHALRRAEERGLAWVNLGGINPGNDGLVRFKRAWGAEAASVTCLRWESGARVLWRNVVGAEEAR